MLHLGWVIIDKIEGGTADCHAEMDANIELTLYLPVLEQTGQAATATGSRILAIYDTVTGIAGLLYNTDGFNFRMSETLSFAKDINVTGKIDAVKDIKSSTGDVIATTVSLKRHVHPAMLTVSATGTVALPSPAVTVTGNASGNTAAPTP